MSSATVRWQSIAALAAPTSPSAYWGWHLFVRVAVPEVSEVVLHYGCSLLAADLDYRAAILETWAAGWRLSAALAAYFGLRLA